MPYNAIKAPDEDLDYLFDWAGATAPGPWLTGGDTIATSTWTVTGIPGLIIVPGPLTMHTTSNSPTTATVWLSGGTVAAQYAVENTIVTAGGRTAVRTLTVSIFDR